MRLSIVKFGFQLPEIFFDRIDDVAQYAIWYLNIELNDWLIWIQKAPKEAFFCRLQKVRMWKKESLINMYALEYQMLQNSARKLPP